MIQPRRNIARTIIVSDTNPQIKSKKNYLITAQQYFFVYGNQKVRKYNDETININKTLQQILQTYITKYNIKNNDLLLPSKQNGTIELSTGAYTKILKTYLGVSSSIIRKIYITEHTRPKLLNMGNSTSTQYNYYYKP